MKCCCLSISVEIIYSHNSFLSANFIKALKKEESSRSVTITVQNPNVLSYRITSLNKGNYEVFAITSSAALERVMQSVCFIHIVTKYIVSCCPFTTAM